VWIQVAAAQVQANQLSKHSNNESSAANSSSSSVASPVLVEARPAIPLLSKTTSAEKSASISFTPESSATAPLARTLEAQIEADLVARQVNKHTDKSIIAMD
jgi:hypothetical protein